MASVVNRERKSEADTVLLHLASDRERQRECLFLVVHRCGLVLQLDLLHVLEYSVIEGNLHNQGANEAATDLRRQGIIGLMYILDLSAEKKVKVQNYTSVVPLSRLGCKQTCTSYHQRSTDQWETRSDYWGLAKLKIVFEVSSLY